MSDMFDITTWDIWRKHGGGGWTCGDCGGKVDTPHYGPDIAYVICEQCQHISRAPESVLFGGTDVVPPRYTMPLNRRIELQR